MIGSVPIAVVICLVFLAAFAGWGVYLAFQRKDESLATKRSHYESGAGGPGIPRSGR